MIHEHESVVLTHDLEGEQLQAGDVGTVVHIHQNGAAYEVEFMTITGKTVAIATVAAEQLRPARNSDLTHIRVLAIK